MKEEIAKIFAEVFLAENADKPLPKLDDDTVLLETGLDSLGFAILVMELEGALGFDPFSLSEEPYYPITFGDMVRFYSDNKPK